MQCRLVNVYRRFEAPRYSLSGGNFVKRNVLKVEGKPYETRTYKTQLMPIVDVFAEFTNFLLSLFSIGVLI